MFPLGVEVWPSVFGCSNTVLQESLRATPLKNNSMRAMVRSLNSFR